ncbi:MAG TPA: BatA and WFA domain-containing protein [bacterium]|nr:BatA and WFA domain-containing protein [bacterium]
MNFLNSAILMGLAAAALPILIHLFTRAKAKPIPFSSLRFLKQLQNQQIRRVKIRQILLLLLRTLAVLCLVLAFARPTCRSRAGADTRSRTSAVILLDNSVSMAVAEGGRTLLETAQNTVGTILAQMQPGDEIYLAAVTDTVRPEYRRAFHDFDALQHQVHATGLQYTETRISAGLRFARNLLATSHNANREIYLISDMQANGFTLDSLPRPPLALRQFALPIQAAHPANLAITGVTLRSAILEVGKSIEIEVALANTGKDPCRNKLVQLFLHGQRVAQRTVSLEPGTTALEPFHFILDRSGWLDGWVQLEDDALLQDNLRYFSLQVPERLDIGLIAAPSRGGELLELALRSAADSSSMLRIATVPPERAGGLQLDSLQLVVLYDVERLPDAAAGNLAAWRDRGGSLLVVLGGRTDIPWYNQRLAPALHLPPVIGQLGQGGSFSLGRIDARHPVFSGIFEGKEPHFVRPQFTRALRLAPAGEENVLMAYSNGDPYLLEARGDRGTVLLFSAGFALEESDMAFRTLFAPLLHRSLRYLASYAQNPDSGADAGDLLRWRAPAGSLQSRLEISGPEGRRDTVHPVVTPSGPWIEYGETALPGIYRLQADGKTLMIWTVNIPAAELNLKPAVAAQVAASHHLVWVEDPAALARIVRQERIGREYWREFLIAALGLLLLEMALYREKSGRTPEE